MDRNVVANIPVSFSNPSLVFLKPAWIANCNRNGRSSFQNHKQHAFIFPLDVHGNGKCSKKTFGLKCLGMEVGAEVVGDVQTESKHSDSPLKLSPKPNLVKIQPKPEMPEQAAAQQIEQDADIVVGNVETGAKRISDLLNLTEPRRYPNAGARQPTRLSRNNQTYVPANKDDVAKKLSDLIDLIGKDRKAEQDIRMSKELEESSTSELETFVEQLESEDGDDKAYKGLVQLVDFVRYTLHIRYNLGETLEKEDEDIILKNVLPYHPDLDIKLQGGVQYLKVDKHPDFDSRCFFIVHLDGSEIDFSFRKCMVELGKRRGVALWRIGKLLNITFTL